MTTICPATYDDLEPLCELLQILFAQEADHTPDRSRQAAGLRLIIDHPQVGCILVARERGQVIGMVSLLTTVSTAQGGWVCWLEDFVVLPAWRGCGVGQRLMDGAIEFARERGFSRISLLTDGDNVAAQRFYARAGFRASQMRLLRRYVELLPAEA